MLDLNFVRDNLALVEEKLRQRGMNPAEVLKDFRTIDGERRQAITAAESLQARRNRASEEIAKLKKSGQDATAQIAETKELREQIAESEKKAAEQEARLREILTSIPNLPHDGVPIGKSEADNVEARRWGSPPQFDFKAKPHWELGEHLGILDLERAAKLTGARFAVYWALGARLERALANFMLDLHTGEHGYTEVLPPYMVNSESMYGTGQLPKFAADLFKVPTGRFEPDPHHIPVVGEVVFATGHNTVHRVVSVNSNNRDADLVLLPERGDPPLVRVPWSALLYQRDFWLIPTAEVPVTN
ncbi:MAG: hypothetical protein ABSC07_04675, partial [Terriglobales bacterium]